MVWRRQIFTIGLLLAFKKLEQTNETLFIFGMDDNPPNHENLFIGPSRFISTARYLSHRISLILFFFGFVIHCITPLTALPLPVIYYPYLADSHA